MRKLLSCLVGLAFLCHTAISQTVDVSGKISDDKGIQVAPEILAKYVGSFGFTNVATHEVTTFIFNVNSGHLFLSGIGPSTPLTAVSETEFTAVGMSLHFVRNDAGAFRETLEREGVEILPGRGLDFLDPWGNRIQVVQYDEIQFTKTDAALRSLGAEALGKTAEAEGEMREKGLL